MQTEEFWITTSRCGRGEYICAPDGRLIARRNVTPTHDAEWFMFHSGELRGLTPAHAALLYAAIVSQR